MFVVINRKILNVSQSAVQSCHAVAEYMNLYSKLESVQDWINNSKTMILLEADECEIDKLVYEFT
jgi:peptidyl-tRNA hydrolase